MEGLFKEEVKVSVWSPTGLKSSIIEALVDGIGSQRYFSQTEKNSVKPEPWTCLLKYMEDLFKEEVKGSVWSPIGLKAVVLKHLWMESETSQPILFPNRKIPL